MNNTQKILIAIGVGVGVAYIYNRYKKGKTTKGSTATIKKANGSFQLPEESATADLTREEKEETEEKIVVDVPEVAQPIVVEDKKKEENVEIKKKTFNFPTRFVPVNR